jgi:putative ATP-dependent endonuclease of OLD family
MDNGNPLCQETGALKYQMHITSIGVKGFRLLSDVHVTLSAPQGDDEEPQRTTVVVGRNNSGKTSLTEVLRRFASAPRFRLEDFSSTSYGDFCEAYRRWKDGDGDRRVREVLPFIEVRITVGYDPQIASYGPLGPFVIDLDDEANEVIVIARYEMAPGQPDELFTAVREQEVASDDGFSEQEMLKALRPNIEGLYQRTLRAEDPGDVTNQRVLDHWRHFEQLFSFNLISAQRGLDDETTRGREVLAGVLDALFKAAGRPEASDQQREVASQLETSVSDVQQQLNEDVGRQLEQLVPALSQFGYPGLHGPAILTEVTLAVETLLQNNTKVLYAGHDGVSLPESYNGLGSRNLIYMLLQLLGFQREFLLRGEEPGINLILVEEPEAHLHPQMQEVFIAQLNRLASIFEAIQEGDGTWPVQFVVSTHSSHIANKAPFSAIRYFLATAEDATPTVRMTTVKDFSTGNQLDDDFLHQYLVLTRCDLFFADKAILIEGTAERLLVPRMVDRLDGGRDQYITYLEVGGAYAYKFFELLDFLQLPAVVITDLDAVDGSRAKCLVSDGVASSNATINRWFAGKLTPSALIAERDDAKVRGLRRIAFQVPEQTDGPCGRTLEDAFVLANAELFALDGDPVAWPQKAEEVAAKWSKSEFAIRHAIEEPGWITPRYIEEGLCWLLALEQSGVPDALAMTGES